MAGFTHLHAHSEYNLRNGLAHVLDQIRTAKAPGFDALTLTNHDVTCGAVQFYQAARRENIQTILGYEPCGAGNVRVGRCDCAARHLVETMRSPDAELMFSCGGIDFYINISFPPPLDSERKPRAKR